MLVRVLLFLIFISTNSIASEFYDGKEKKSFCNKDIVFNSKTDSIEVEILNHRKWIEGLLKLIIEFNQPTTKTSDKGHFDFIINDAYKKYYKSKVKINYNKSNITCEFDAKVKITGDGYWHLDWDVGKPFVSVQVKLVDGNINNIVNFKLLLPKSRASDNEIFITSLLRYLNFLAPRTFYTNAKINGVNKKYIFQEDLNKELLESNSLVEGPIIEGDERFTIEKKFKGKNFYPFSISRISNHKYIKGDLPKMNKSLEAITLMNKIYIQSHLSYPNSIEKLNINPQIENDLFSEDFNTYESLIYAMDADHGQSHDDRRFYYDPINNYFLPIYYDGKPGILNYKINRLSGKKNLDYITNVLKNSISQEAVKGSGEAIQLIKNIENEKVLKIINQNGLKMTKKEFSNLKDIIINRLEIIKDIKLKKIKFKILDSYFEKFKNEKDLVNLVFANKNQIEICNIDLSDCKKKIIDYENVRYLYAQSFNFLKDKDDKIFLFIGKNKSYHEKVRDKKFVKYKINKNFNIKHNNKIKFNIDYKNKILDIFQKDSYGRAIIFGDKVNGWNINFFGSKIDDRMHAKRNYSNLTGCLTFVDIKFTNVNLFAENTKCEDAINLIRTDGYIDKINIQNNIYDGLDMDFSNLSIDNVTIDNAKNDCVDLSFGKYKIQESKLTKCGDKGVSVGEKSNAFLKNITISDSNIGIASKDSSFVEVNNSNIHNTKICLSAYRKKQEFNSATIKINNLHCHNFEKKIDVDTNSIVMIENL
jgi:hypothetical protein